MRCFVCDEVIDIDIDDVTPFGYDGDFIHTKCKKNVNKAKDRLNNMSDKEFADYLQGVENGRLA